MIRQVVRPTLISTTWGGSDSKQGLGPKGGANRVEMRDQIERWWHKPVWVTPESVAASR